MIPEYPRQDASPPSRKPSLSRERLALPSLETKVSQGLQDVAAAPGVPMLGGEVAAEALLAR